MKAFSSEESESISSILVSSLAPSKSLQDSLTKMGTLSPGAIANLGDVVGFSAIHSYGHLWKVSTDISISYMATAKLHDELEMTSKVLGHKGGSSGAVVLLKNKATGEVVAEGRHSVWET